MSELIVGSTLARVGKDLVGFFGLLELMLRIGIARIAIRVKFHRQAAKGFFQILLCGALFGAKDLIIITLGHIVADTVGLLRPVLYQSAAAMGNGSWLMTCPSRL